MALADASAERALPVAPALILIGLFLVALAVRWPYLVQVPELTDETIEIGRALSIARGERFPLTSYVAFTGPVFHYPLAAVFAVFGPSLLAARLTVAVAGALTVLATYLLGRTMAGQTVGLLAAAFMATSSVHTIASGHLAWTHSTTPLFVSLALWQLARGVERRSRWSLALFALLFGLALQSHPSVFLLLPAVAVYLVWKARRLLDVKLTLALAGLLTLAYANMLIYNASRGFNSVAEAFEKESDYARTLPEGSRGYWGRAPEVVYTLVRLPGSKLEPRPFGETPPVDVLAFAMAGLSLAGVVALAARGQPLPALAVASLTLLLPLTSAQHALLPRQGRYLVPVLPLIYVGLGYLLVRILASARSRIAGLALVIGITALVLIPLGQTLAYYQGSMTAGRTNERYFEAIALLRELRTSGTPVLLDQKLSQERTGAGGNALLSLQTLAAFDGITVGLLSNENRINRLQGRESNEFVLLSPRDPDDMARKIDGSGLAAVVLQMPRQPSPYWLYSLRSTQRL